MEEYNKKMIIGHHLILSNNDKEYIIDLKSVISLKSNKNGEEIRLNLKLYDGNDIIIIVNKEEYIDIVTFIINDGIATKTVDGVINSKIKKYKKESNFI